MRKSVDTGLLLDCLKDQVELCAKMKRTYRKYNEACRIKHHYDRIALDMEEMDGQLKTEVLQADEMVEGLESIIQLTNSCEKQIHT